MRPGIVVGALGGRLVEQLKVDDIRAAVPQRGADAVRAGVAAADHDHVLVLGGEVLAVLEIGIEQTLGVAREEIHREMNTLEVTTGIAAGRVKRFGRTGGHQHGIEILLQIVGVDVLHLAAALFHDLRHVAGFELVLFTNVRAGDELHALVAHEIDAALNDVLVQLHVRDTVHQQAANAVGAFINRHGVADFVQLIRRSQTSRAGADDRDLFAGALGRRFGAHPALVEGAVDDRVLDVLDGDRRIGDAEHARTFARRRTHAAGELREIVGLVQTFDRLFPALLINEMIPLGDEVVDRAAVAGLAKRHAAIHATRALRLQVALLGRGVDLVVIVQALQRIAIRHRLALKLHKSSWFTHLEKSFRPATLGDQLLLGLFAFE